MVDVAVAPAQHVGLQRREHGLAVALEDERLRLVQAVDLGLAEAAAERPSHQPLEFDRAGGTHVEVGGQARVGFVGPNTQRLEARQRQHPRLLPGDRGAHRVRPPAPSRPRVARERGGVTRGGLQPDGDRDPGLAGIEVIEALAMPGREGLQRLGVRGALGQEIARVLRDVEGSAHPQDLQVRLDGLERRDQAREALALVGRGQAVEGMRRGHEQRPRVAIRAAETEVAVDEAQRGAHG